MNAFGMIVLVFLVICAIAASVSKNLLVSVVIFMAYSVLMSIVWMMLESPEI